MHINEMNLSVEEFTTPGLITMSCDQCTLDAKNIMEKHNIRHLPILRDEAVVGVISQRDLARINPDNSCPIAEIMSKNILFASVSDKIQDVAYNMSQKKVGSALIQDNSNKLYGIFTTTDALNALIEVVRGHHRN